MAGKQAYLNKSRLDKFVLVFNLPDILKESKRKSMTEDADLQDQVQLSIHGTVVPAIKIPAVQANFGGQVLQASSFARPTYDDVSVEFNVDNRFKNYSTIWKWLQILNDSKQSTYDKDQLFKISDRGPLKGTRSTQDLDYLKEYTTNMSLFAVDEYNKNIAQFTYIQAFPISLGEIRYSYQDANEITCTFSFSFSQMDFKLLIV